MQGLAALLDDVEIKGTGTNTVPGLTVPPVQRGDMNLDLEVAYANAEGNESEQAFIRRCAQAELFAAALEKELEALRLKR